MSQASTSKSGSLNALPAARALDHAVLPVGDLASARARLGRLGFTVAGDASHPFGTENACVFFADGTYIEPLAVGQREACEAAAQNGNVFVARDQAWRFRNGQSGFSGIGLSSADAKADHGRFVAAGISAGKTLSCSRKIDDGKGGKANAGFKLAFAADLRSPDSFVFACQRLGMANDRSKLQRHANGVVAIRTIVASESNPADFQYFLQEVLCQREVSAHSFGMDIKTATARLSVYNNVGMLHWFGIDEPVTDRGLKLCGLVFAVRSLAKCREMFVRNGVAMRHLHGRILVDAVPGQGALFAFEAAK